MAKIYGTPIMAGGAGGVSDTLPPMVTNLAAVAGNQQITVTYKNPVSDALAGVLVVYKTGSYPTKPTDGNKVDAGLSEKAILEGLENGADYYIRVFPYNAKKQYQTLIDGATTTARPSEGPKQVTDLKVTGSGSSPVLSWKNPTDDPTYHETVVIQKVDSAPTSLSDGTEIYRGTGETVSANGLERLKNYYWGVFTVNAEGGTRGPVTTEVYSFDFPTEPTEYTEIEKIYATREWEAPEDGWFKFIIASSGGRGGESHCSSWGSSTGIRFGAGGGSPGCAVSEIAMNKGEKMLLTVSATDITCSVKDVQMVSTRGDDGGLYNSNPNGNGGDGGTATGGNKSNHNGIKGGSTGGSEQSGSYYGSYVAGRSGGNLQVEGYSFYGGTGGGGTRILNEGRFYVWGAQILPTNGSTAVCIVLRGNTNIPAPSQASTLSLLPTDSTLTVDWANSGDPVQTGTTLVYNTNHVPTSVNDGVSVDIPVTQAVAATFAVDGEEQRADTKKQSYAITGLTNNKPVYVALFPYDANKKYGIPKTDVEIPRAHSWYDAQQELQVEVATVKAEMADYQEYYATTQEVLK